MKPLLYYDLETYPNYFLAYFLAEDGTERHFEIINSEQSWQASDLLDYISPYKLVGFNNKRYDDLLLNLALTGGVGYSGKVTLEDNGLNAILKTESDNIILHQVMPWTFCKLHKLSQSLFDTLDIMNVLPGQASLKLYGARAGSGKLQELPIDPDTTLTHAQMVQIRKYCRNDLEVTQQLHRLIIPQMGLRETINARYGLDTSSSSDPQIAEMLLAHSYYLQTGNKLKKPPSPPSQYVYHTPEWVKFTSPKLKNLLASIESATILLSDKGSLIAPTELKQVVRYGNMSYQMGIGGLHSINGTGYYLSKDGYTISDQDV